MIYFSQKGQNVGQDLLMVFNYVKCYLLGIDWMWESGSCISCEQGGTFDIRKREKARCFRGGEKYIK